MFNAKKYFTLSIILCLGMQIIHPMMNPNHSGTSSQNGGYAQPEEIIISHKKLLKVLNKHGLDLEKEWEYHDFDKQNPIGQNEPVDLDWTSYDYHDPRFNSIGLMCKAFILTSCIVIVFEFLGEFVDRQTAFMHVSDASTILAKIIFCLAATTTFGNKPYCPIDALAYKIISFFKQALHNQNGNQVSSLIQDLGLQDLDASRPITIECINKIECEPEENSDDASWIEKLHAVSMENVSAQPNDILLALAVVIAYHFTAESLQQRAMDHDTTCRDIPLLAIKISQPAIVSSREYIDPKTTIEKMFSSDKLISIFDSCGDVQSKITTMDHNLDLSIFNEEYEKYQEYQQPLAGTIKKFFIAYLYFSHLFIPQHNFPPLTPEDPVTKIMPEHDVHFALEDGRTIGCSLYQNLSLTCCPQGYDDLCRTLNIVSNADPLNNCCLTDPSGQTTCSTALCSNPESIQALCSNGQQANGVNFSDLHCSIINELRDDIVQNTHPKSVLQKAPLFKSLLQHISNNLNLENNNRIDEVKIVNDRCINADVASWNNRLRITQGFLKHDNIQDTISTMGHELTHKYQHQTNCHSNLWRKIILNCTRSSMPGDEIDADILGALAVLDLNGNSINNKAISALKSFLHDANASLINQSTLCSTELPIINQSNLASIENLMRTDKNNAPHPDSLVRATMLLKLDTMIKALLKYFKQELKIKNS